DPILFHGQRGRARWAADHEGSAWADAHSAKVNFMIFSAAIGLGALVDSGLRRIHLTDHLHDRTGRRQAPLGWIWQLGAQNDRMRETGLAVLDAQIGCYIRKGVSPDRAVPVDGPVGAFDLRYDGVAPGGLIEIADAKDLRTEMFAVGHGELDIIVGQGCA